jgi:hypothetical protein
MSPPMAFLRRLFNKKRLLRGSRLEDGAWEMGVVGGWMRGK